MWHIQRYLSVNFFGVLQEISLVPEAVDDVEGVADVAPDQLNLLAYSMRRMGAIVCNES
jgi:hypothetical protein